MRICFLLAGAVNYNVFELSISPLIVFYNDLNLYFLESHGSRMPKVGRFAGRAYDSGTETAAAHLFFVYQVQ